MLNYKIFILFCTFVKDAVSIEDFAEAILNCIKGKQQIIMPDEDFKSVCHRCR